MRPFPSGHDFRVTYELAENHLLFGVPFIQSAAKLVLSGKPYTFRVEHQAILIHVLTQHESFFRSGLQLFPEGGRDENSSFCIRLSSILPKNCIISHLIIISDGKNTHFPTIPHNLLTKILGRSFQHLVDSLFI